MSVEMKRIGDILHLQNGRAFKPAEWTTNGLPIVRIQNLNNSEAPFNHFDGVAHEKFRIYSGDLLFSWSGTPGTSFGAFLWDRGDAWLNQHIFKITFDDSFIDKRYLLHAINSRLQLIIDQSHGGVGLKHITKGKLEAIKLPIPDLSEQQRIAAILGKADEIRHNSMKAEDFQEEIIESIFFEIFGDPILNTNNYQFYELIELMSDGFQNGLYIPKEKYTEIDGVEMVHMSDAFYDTVQRGSLKQALLDESEIEKYNLSSNNLLITRRSLNYEGAAKSCRIPESNPPLVFESSLIRLTPNEKIVNSTFLHFYINNKRVREAYVYKFVTKSTISGINQKNLSQIPVMLPPIELQNKFESVVYQIEKNFRSRKSLTEYSDNLNKSMVNKLISNQ